MAEFIECSSLSISYDATGKASVSMTVIKDNMGAISTYSHLSAGGVSFTLAAMNVTQAPIHGSNGWAQWSLQLEGVGN